MTEYLKHRKSLATKRGKKPAVAATFASSQPAVASSPLLGSPSRFPSVSHDSKIRDAVLSVLQSLSQSGSVGINPLCLSAPSTVPDYAPPVGAVIGGDGGKKPHNVGSLTGSSGVGAFEYQTTSTMNPDVHPELSYVSTLSDRSGQVTINNRTAQVAAPVGHPPIPLARSGVHQLRVVSSSALTSASSALSPTSLLFPLPVSGISSLRDPSFSSYLSSASGSSLGSSLASSSSSTLSFLLFLFLLLLPCFLLLFPLQLRPLFLLLSILFFPLPFLFLILSLHFFLPSLLAAASSLVPSFVPPPRGFPPSSSSPSFPPFLPPPPPSSSFPSSVSSSSCSVPPPSSSSSFFGSLSSSALADYQAQLLGLSPDYQSLARLLVGSGGTDFAEFVSSSYPHLLPDLLRDFASGSSLFLAALHSPSLLLPPGSLASPHASSASIAPAAAFPHFLPASVPAVPSMASQLSASSSCWLRSCFFPGSAWPSSFLGCSAAWLLPPFSATGFFPPPTASSSAALSSSALPVPPSSSFRDSAVVPGCPFVL